MCPVIFTDRSKLFEVTLRLFLDVHVRELAKEQQVRHVWNDAEQHPVAER